MFSKLLQRWRGVRAGDQVPVDGPAIAPVVAVAPSVTVEEPSPPVPDAGVAVATVSATDDEAATLGDDSIGATAQTTPTAEARALPAPYAVDASVTGLTAELRRRTSTLASEMPGEDVRRLLDDLAESPTAIIRQLPAAAQRALALTQLTDPPVQRVTEVFEEDPTLAQALLLQANSSLYGAGRPCLSVRDALQRLGVVAARNVLLGHTVSALLCRPGGAYAAMVDNVWSHMVRTAPIARRLASPFNADAEEAFGLGLLHDVGKLVVFDRLTTLRIDGRRDFAVAPDDLKRILRALHEPLGGLAAHTWGLGDSAAEAIATHHRTPVPAVRNALSEVLCVAEASDLAAVHGDRGVQER